MRLFYEEVMEKKVTARGVHGMTKGRRNKRPNLDTKIQLSAVTIHRADGSRVEVPAEFFSKKDGSLKKSKVEQYNKLMKGGE